MPKPEISIVAHSGGRVYNLNSLSCGFLVSEMDNMNVNTVRRLTQKSPGQLGVTDLGWGMDARAMPFVWRIVGSSPADLYNLRSELAGIFKPRINDPIVLVFTLPNGTQRAIDVNLESNVELSGRFSRAQTAGLILTAADPRFYDPNQKLTSTSVQTQVYKGWPIGSSAATSFGTSFGWDIDNPGAATVEMGWIIGESSTASATVSITYAGAKIDADIEYPIIIIRGPITNPVLTNTGTGETIDMSAEGGLNLSLGQFVTLDLRPEEKRTYDQDGNSMDHFITQDSDFYTFHLAYNTELLNATTGVRSNGVNNIKITGTDVSDNTTLEVYHYDRFVAM